MESQSSILQRFLQLVSEHKLTCISGESGTGKTTLACQLVGTYLALKRTDTCLWVQASEIFPKTRIAQLFQEDLNALDHIFKNTFVAPKNKTFNSYHDQLEFLKKFSENTFVLPPSLKYVVIDNISHHLRYELFQAPDVRAKCFMYNRFFDELLLPLIMYCRQNNIYLILIHEVSYNPETNKNVLFFRQALQ